MRSKINDKIYRIVQYLEMGVAILVAISIGVAFFHLVMELVGSFLHTSKIEGMTHFIEDALTVAVGIEFAKLLCKHKASTVIEVLIFAVARHMIGESTTITENLICIVSIAILFVVRKYMFHKYDEVEKTVFSPATKVKKINSVCGVHIPYQEPDDSLLKIFLEHYGQNVTEIMKGSTVFFHDCAIRISKYRNQEIVELEVIRIVRCDIANYNL